MEARIASTEVHRVSTKALRLPWRFKLASMKVHSSLVVPASIINIAQQVEQLPWIWPVVTFTGVSHSTFMEVAPSSMEASIYLAATEAFLSRAHEVTFVEDKDFHGCTSNFHGRHVEEFYLRPQKLIINCATSMEAS